MDLLGGGLCGPDILDGGLCGCLCVDLLGGGLCGAYLLVEVDLHKLPEAAAVVVPDCFGVPEGLEEWIG